MSRPSSAGFRQRLLECEPDGVIPSGSYEAGQLSNIALNHPALDLTGALTYLDAVLGYELSVIPGIAFNRINPATQYPAGTEFHFEWSASKYLTKALTIGLVGYFYDQFSGDSGPGDRIGPFNGRMTALAGSIGDTFKLGEISVSTSVRVLREFETQNRLEGNRHMADRCGAALGCTAETGT